MKYILILILLAVAPYYADRDKEKNLYSSQPMKLQVSDIKTNKIADEVNEIARSEFIYSKLNSISMNEINKMLLKHSDTVNKNIIDVVLSTIQCSIDSNIPFNNNLVIIDYSLPTHEKRFWLFDLEKKKLLFHTYVSHGLRSGILKTNYFSNKVGSKASSIGVYHTGKSYRGRHGLSLKLNGLENGFNSNSMIRFIVMHSSWYVENDFINKYGRTGRSWGCPAIPRTLIKPVIDNISEHSLFIIYYPSKEWLTTSKFLNCKHLSSSQRFKNFKILLNSPEDEDRGEILYVDKNNNNKREENEPILTVSSKNYKILFNNDAPLKRMLRRQYNNTEQIALNHTELQKLDINKDKTVNQEDKGVLKTINFLIPEVKKIRGFYATEFKSVNIGKIKEIKITEDENELYTSKSTIKIKSSGKFIRWLGL